jgi:hypothetical protein
VTAYRSPQGEVLDIPAEGEQIMRALGWEPVVPQPTPKTPRSTRGRVRKT